MNKKDLKILKIMKDNVRMPYSKIAKRMGMTENAVKYRIKKMEKAGVIKGYFMNLSSKMLGKEKRVIFQMNVKPAQFSNSIKILEGYKEIAEIYRCSGQYSIICTGFFKDEEDLVNFLDRRLLKELPVTTWVEHIILMPYKETFFNVDMLD